MKTSQEILADEDGTSRILDEKLMELQSLFEVSQTLNSSLNLTSILDNMLLTPMGKMMITRGIVLLYKEKNKLSVETLKGLPQELVGKIIDEKIDISEPTFLTKEDEANLTTFSFLVDNNIVLLLPIRSSDKNLGYIGFGNKILNKDYSKSELEYLKSLSNIAATSIENGLMVLKLQDINRRLDKKIQELNTIFEIGKELNSTLDSDKILNLLSYAVMGEMIINRCLIFLEENGEMKLQMSKGLQSTDELALFEKEDFLEKLFELTDPIYLKKENEYSSPLQNFQKTKFPVIVPMRIQNKTKGILAIGERITKTPFYDDDLEFLFTLGNEALICLENARLFEETLEKQKMEEELALAREIQQKLLPKKCPQLEKYEVEGINISSLHVSGDYFDCIKLDENNYCLAIADVSGKGTPASLLMANLQAVLNALIDSNSNLEEITGRINNLIHKNTNYDKFITFFIGILNIQENSFQYVNAGHNPPFFMHKDGNIELLESGGLILGMMPNVPYEQDKVQLKQGDWIVMFTDGVTEAQDKDGEDFEEERLMELLQENKFASAEVMKDKILTAVKEFTGDVPQSDDITLLILKVTG
ncbi:SpoIIE family protein phosphatase [candidate division KSB1 bacterium]|nr:SpoIIE family protein phosphatase [candidate division KSB1 bacterium]